MEDNRQLQHMVMRVDTEKKRLSMENEQLSWKMSQSFVGGKEFTVANTPDGEFCLLSMWERLTVIDRLSA